MAKVQLSAAMKIPELIAAYPAARRVLDRYGLEGCGGPLGPNETIEWFARMHGVPVGQLLRELKEAIEQSPRPQGRLPEYRPSVADTIYRPFFIAGMLISLSVGCLWGALNLFQMGRASSFGAVDYSWTLAHGHSMVFGFVGLFIMGFSYQAFPRFKHSRLPHPKLAVATLLLMLGGLVLQVGGHLGAPQPGFLAAGLAGGVIQVIAVGAFAWIIWRVFRQSEIREPADPLIKSAVVWFLLAAILNPLIFWLFETAQTREAFLFRVATFNIPYRDIQLLGVAVLMVLGVSLRYLPHAYGFRMPSAGWRKFMLWGGNGAIGLSIASFLAGMLWQPRLLALTEIASLVLLAIAIGTPLQYGLFRRLADGEGERGLKFIRAAYGWFIVAMAMLAFMPVYDLLIYKSLTGAEVPFSHAYFGAYRHALTVGFIVMMIVGVSSRVVPTLSGLDSKSINQLWIPFVLLNLGNFGRVSLEIATDFHPPAFQWMGLTGFVEVTGLAIWAGELFRNMIAGKRAEPASTRGTQPVEIAPETKVADIVEAYPETLEVFLQLGFEPLANPLMRRTLARAVSLREAARHKGYSVEELIDQLKQVAGKPTCQPRASSEQVVPVETLLQAEKK